MSTLFDHILKNSSKEIKGSEIRSGICLGTKEDVINNLDKIKFEKIRVCFDLDNTILKYRLQVKNILIANQLRKLSNLLNNYIH